MAHKKLEFLMPASEAVVFDAFHYHQWRARWDSLVSTTHVLGGSPCPFVGAVTENTGAGALRGLSMRTQFVSYDRPRVAAASMLGQSFPFTKWAASMRHRATGPQQSVLIYTYNFEVGPAALRWFIAPVVGWLFSWQTRRRFARLHDFLALHAAEVAHWQQDRPGV
ncbi:MAG: hypothetical protein JWP96_29 [Polaromonas sp.]|nr:hypothetical protein [Polaromonas sp.]